MLESKNLASFLIGSYTNNSLSGEFLTNSEVRSSYSPNLDAHKLLSYINMPLCCDIEKSRIPGANFARFFCYSLFACTSYPSVHGICQMSINQSKSMPFFKITTLFINLFQVNKVSQSTNLYLYLLFNSLTNKTINQDNVNTRHYNVQY